MRTPVEYISEYQVYYLHVIFADLALGYVIRLVEDVCYNQLHFSHVVQKIGLVSYVYYYQFYDPHVMLLSNTHRTSDWIRRTRFLLHVLVLAYKSCGKKTQSRWFGRLIICVRILSNMTNTIRFLALFLISAWDLWGKL